MFARLTLAALAAGAMCAPALAQSPQMTPAKAKQLACISDRLVAEKVDVSIAQVYARGDEKGQEYDANVKAMDEAMVACQQQYKWTDHQTNLAAQVGMFQIVMDNFSHALSKSKGVTPAAFDQLGTVLTALPRADQDVILDGAWRDNDPLIKRVSAQLIAAGLPSDSTVLAFAFLIMEAKLVVTYSTMDWAEITR